MFAGANGLHAGHLPLAAGSCSRFHGMANGWDSQTFSEIIEIEMLLVSVLRRSHSFFLVLSLKIPGRSRIFPLPCPGS